MDQVRRSDRLKRARGEEEGAPAPAPAPAPIASRVRRHPMPVPPQMQMLRRTRPGDFLAAIRFVRDVRRRFNDVGEPDKYMEMFGYLAEYWNGGVGPDVLRERIRVLLHEHHDLISQFNCIDPR